MFPSGEITKTHEVLEGINVEKYEAERKWGKLFRGIWRSINNTDKSPWASTKAEV